MMRAEGEITRFAPPPPGWMFPDFLPGLPHHQIRRQTVEGIVDRFGELLARLGFQLVELPGPSAGSPEQVIRFLVGRLVDAGCLLAEHAEDAIGRVLAREQLGPTAIGEGVALPHATTPSIHNIAGVGARSASGVPWRAPDGQPVQRICLILAPPDRPGDYLRVLEALSQGLRRRN
jgi:mannitol/fructose-specific phosphotransferase system IIA component (Ntr-type)